MSDILKRLAEADAPESREVTIGTDTGTIWFRRISGAEREDLLKGMKLAHRPGLDAGTIDIDLGQNERQRHLLLLYSVCNEQGERVFKKLDDVRKLQGYKIKALWKHASEINREDDDPGKD